MTSAAVRTVGGGAGTSIQRALSRQIASTMPVSAERVSAARVDARIDREHAARHLVGQLVAAPSVDQCRHPPHRERRLENCWRRRGGAVAGATSGTIAPRAVSSTAHTATRPNQRTLGHDVARPGRLPPRPAIRGPRRPGRRTRGAAPPPGRRDRRVADPPRRRRTRRAEHRHHRIAVGGGRARVPRPMPRRVPAPTTPAPGALPAPAPVPRVRGGFRSDRLLRSTTRSAPPSGGRGRSVEPRPRRRQPAEIGLRVGEHLVAFLAPERSRTGRRTPRRRAAGGAARRATGSIGFEHRELLGRRVAVGFRLDPEVELPRGNLGSRRGGLIRHRLRSASDSRRTPTVLEEERTTRQSFTGSGCCHWTWSHCATCTTVSP